jgi:hypothetical protein
MRLHDTVRRLREAGVTEAQFDSEGNLLLVRFADPAALGEVAIQEEIRKSLAKVDEQWENLSEEEKQNRRLYGHT